MGGLTFRTDPETDIEIKGVKKMSTVVTAFGRGVVLVNLDQRASIPVSLVRQLADELPPTNVTDRFGKAMVLDHILDLQALYTYDLVLAYELGRELVLIITASIAHPSMNASDLPPRFLTVFRAFFLLSMPMLCPCQFLCFFGKVARVAIRLPITGHNHAFDTQVKPNHLRRNFQWLDILFNQEGDKVAIRTILRDRDGGRLCPL